MNLIVIKDAIHPLGISVPKKYTQYHSVLFNLLHLF